MYKYIYIYVYVCVCVGGKYRDEKAQRLQKMILFIKLLKALNLPVFTLHKVVWVIKWSEKTEKDSLYSISVGSVPFLFSVM